MELLKAHSKRKITRIYYYEIGRIIMEVTNRFKGLDLIERLKNHGQRFVTWYRRQGSRPPPIKRNAKWQNGSLRSSYKEL